MTALILIYNQEDLIENSTAVFKCQVKFEGHRDRYSMRMFFSDDSNRELDVVDKGDAQTLIKVSY